MIVVADDDRGVRETCAKILEAAGHIVRQAENGAQAIEICRRHPVSVAFLDVMMPDTDGFETLLALKRECPNTKVVVMTGANTASYDYLRMARGLGADLTIAKPFRFQELLSAIPGAAA